MNSLFRTSPPPVQSRLTFDLVKKISAADKNVIQYDMPANGVICCKLGQSLYRDSSDYI